MREAVSEAWQEKRETWGQNRKCKRIQEEKSFNNKHKKNYQSWWMVDNITTSYGPKWQK